MSFNPDPSKRTPEVIFCRQIKKLSHPVLTFNNNRVIQTPYQKHLCLILDEKLNFGEDLIYIANRVNTSTGLLHKLKKYLPRGSLVLYTNSLLDLIMIMEMLSLIKRIINHSMKA